MAHAFKIIPGKPAFGTLKQVVFQSDYLAKKKAQRTVCTSQANCGQIKNAKSYEEVNQYKEGFRLNTANRCNVLPFNKSDLIVNLYSKMNLKDACTMINEFPCIDPVNCSNACSGPKTINNTNQAFNWNHTIDPVGDLFGNSQCGIQNYTEYMVFSPPNNINNLVDISNSSGIVTDPNSGNNGLDPQLLQASLLSIDLATNQALSSINSRMLSATSAISSTTEQSVAAINDQLFSATSMMSSTTEQSVAAINNQIFSATSEISSTAEQSVAAINDQMVSATSMMSATASQSVDSINSSAYNAYTNITNFTNNSSAALNQQLLQAMLGIGTTQEELITMLTLLVNSNLLNATTNINAVTAEAINNINIYAYNAISNGSGGGFNNEQLIQVSNNLLNKINYLFETFFHADSVTIIENYPLPN